MRWCHSIILRTHCQLLFKTNLRGWHAGMPAARDFTVAHSSYIEWKSLYFTNIYFYLLLLPRRRDSQRASIFGRVSVLDCYLRQVWRQLCDHVGLSIIQSLWGITATVISRFQWNLMLWLGLPIERTFGGDSVPDMDSGSLFHFPQHFGIVDFRRFISISHTVTGRNDWPTTFREQSGRHPDLTTD